MRYPCPLFPRTIIQSRVSSAFSKLPSSKTYLIRAIPDDISAYPVELSWGLCSFSFDLNKKRDKKGSVLVRHTNSASAERSKVNRALSATYMVRDMIMTMSEDFGPAQLDQANKTLASMHEASMTSIICNELLEKGYAQVHMVGRSAWA